MSSLLNPTIPETHEGNGELDWLAQSIVTPTREGGRPSKYSPETAHKFLHRMIEGESLLSICRSDEMPGIIMVWWWRKTHERFGKAFEQARVMQAEALASKALDAAEAAHDKDSAQAARVKTETFLKVAARIDPDRWGEKPSMAGGVQLTINTNLDLPAGNKSSDPLVIEAKQMPALEDEPEDIFG